MSDEELGAWLRLTLTPGVGNVTARKLLAAFGSAPGVFSTSVEARSSVVGEKTARALAEPPETWAPALEQALLWLASAQRHHVLTLGDAHYPSALLETADPPLMLYGVGQLETLGHPRKLAVVGSRNPTPQGAENARQFAQALAERGLCIVSGLALGVDGAAHEGALAAGGTTIAVVGTGADRVYPRRHLALAHRIAEQGLLLSEYPLGTAPLAPNFPKRNRIIAGLSLGTLVVEAAVQSGSLITAQLAVEMGRDVFAIPGSIHAPQARGCHALIRQGAKLVESAQDILEDLHLATTAANGAAETRAGNECEAERDPLLQALGHDPVGLDALQARTGLSTPELQTQLLTLELDGTVRRLPGGLFQRLVLA